MSWNKIDDRDSDDRIEHESEEEREVKADLKILGAIQASEKNNVEVKIGRAHV